MNSESDSPRSGQYCNSDCQETREQSFANGNGKRRYIGLPLRLEVSLRVEDRPSRHEAYEWSRTAPEAW